MKFVSLSLAFDSKAKLKLLGFIFHNYAPMSEREMAKVLGVSHSSVNRIMRQFYELDLVYPKRVGNVTTWERNEKSLSFTELGRLASQIKRLPSPKEHLVKTIVSELAGQPVQKAVLFGSVAEGKERSGSDIDLFILTPNEKTKSSLSGALGNLLSKCLETYGNPLSPLVLTENEFKHPTNKHLIENILKGLVVIPELGA